MVQRESFPVELWQNKRTCHQLQQTKQRWNLSTGTDRRSANQKTLNSYLTWNNHVEYLVMSAFRNFFIQTKRSGVDIIAEIVQYNCFPLCSSNISKRRFRAHIQKRALRCIFPCVPYSTALELANIQSIDDHHETLTNKLSQNIKESPNSKVKHLLRERHESTTYDLRVQNPLVVPRTKTKRFSNSFIIADSKAYNQSNKKCTF
jgi:hypothetical protein